MMNYELVEHFVAEVEVAGPVIIGDVVDALADVIAHMVHDGHAHGRYVG